MATEKTIRQWLNDLKQPYKKEAIKNFDAKARGSKRESLADALFEAFVWGETLQGHDYWSNLEKEVRLEEEN